MAQPATATPHILTTEPTRPDNLIVLDNTTECEDTYACPCLGCHLDRQRALRRGVRTHTTHGIPIRKAA